VSGMFLFALFARVSQLNDLLVPSWIDGLTHQEFLSRLIERQRMSIEAIYPKGFHANAAFVLLLFKNSPNEAILMLGQWLSLISGLGFYFLARRVLIIRQAQFALGLFWFWSMFPAYLINWSRYPLLQGLVILPLATAIYIDGSLKKQSQTSLIALLSIGLVITYYGSFVMFGAFVLVDLVRIITKYDTRIDPQKKMRWIAFFIFPSVLILLIRFGRILFYGLRIYGQDASTGWIDDVINVVEISLKDSGWIVWITGMIGFVLALIYRNHRLLPLLGWVLSLSFINILQFLFNITISSFANTFIFISIPLALMAGFAFKYMIVPQRKDILGYFLIAFLTFFGSYKNSGIVSPSNILLFPADLKAFEWITENIIPNSVFMVNSFAWGDDRAPSDGGGWISYFTENKYILYEPKIFEKVVRENEIDYIYVGRGYGELNPDIIKNNNQFTLVYDSDGVKIFKRTR